ncbi:MAG TPA: hypothetical protein VFU90_13590, partial [Candidatus Tumulicola sp.]|nr:hypothetical protein [Candidatus Tumulicola sp.]
MQVFPAEKPCRTARCCIADAARSACRIAASRVASKGFGSIPRRAERRVGFSRDLSAIARVEVNVSTAPLPPGHAWPPEAQGLYAPVYEHDACGLGFVAHIKGTKSHAIIEQGLQILKNLTHRGATGADPLQGDGAGILIQLPDAFFRRACGRLGITLPAIGQYGVGMVFLPQEPASRMACEQEVERAIAAEGQVLLGWRDVPTRNGGLSERTREVEPLIRQVFVARGSRDMDQDALERKLYVIRKRAGHAIQSLALRHGKEFYVPSMSTRTIVYKGMLLADQVGTYYL